MEIFYYHTNLCLGEQKVNLTTLIEGDSKAPFSIATTLREGATPFPGLLHFTLDQYLIMLSVKQVGIKYHFWVFGMTRPGIEPCSTGPLLIRQKLLTYAKLVTF